MKMRTQTTAALNTNGRLHHIERDVILLGELAALGAYATRETLAACPTVNLRIDLKRSVREVSKPR